MLVILALTGVFFIGGMYAGSAVYLLATTGSAEGTAFRTLLDANNQALAGRVQVYLPWAWATTLAVTLFPIGVWLVALISRIRPQNTLHGNARFANARELKQFAYRGEYY
ncbi:hypothetical protein QYE73_23005 [Pseudomonas mosselii]|uniref:hypothetical protein n=1 Tax=Pseudomonas mosselii TaxID=78327 RepID=UPI002616C3E6|nr:hypothetical protein [Pseudomonas mosselii]MDN4500162.1 hypothetical protein [Pseudomonas mosselii]